MISLAIVSPKGGVGKTTLALNLAYAFAESGRRTLLVDTDPQGGIGHSLTGKSRDSAGFAELVGGDAVAPVRTRKDNLSILPMGAPPWSTLTEWTSRAANPTVFAQAMSRFEHDFDIAIIDTPAGLSGSTYGALSYCSHALLPRQTEPLALRTTMQLLQVIAAVRAAGARISLAAVVLTMARFRDELSLSVTQEAWELFPGGLVLDAFVPRDAAFLAASAAGVPVGLLRKRPPPVASVFDRLVTELEPVLGLMEADEDETAIPLLD